MAAGKLDTILEEGRVDYQTAIHELNLVDEYQKKLLPILELTSSIFAFIQAIDLGIEGSRTEIQKQHCQQAITLCIFLEQNSAEISDYSHIESISQICTKIFFQELFRETSELSEEEKEAKRTVARLTEQTLQTNAKILAFIKEFTSNLEAVRTKTKPLSSINPLLTRPSESLVRRILAIMDKDPPTTEEVVKSPS